MQDYWISSIGLDLGTSTTKLIFSRLHLMSTAGMFALPRVEIVERELLYRSPIYTTPLLNDREIDMEAVSQILQKEYQNSMVHLSDVKAGAVIITGETAIKKNAQQVVHYLAERAGDFVVATAGADLEGILAGKGSGAEARSLEKKGVIANIDIGGGTANIAFFEKGKTIGTVTFHIGGRLIRLTQAGEILYVSEAIREWLLSNGFRLKPGMRITYEELTEVCVGLCKSMISYLTGGKQHNGELLLLGEAAADYPEITEIMVSGGVGSLMMGTPPENLEEVAIYGDMGPLLAHMFSLVCSEYQVKLEPAHEAGRATVIGAGMQSTEISGATIHAPPSLLPLRNVPVIQIDLGKEELWSDGYLERELANAIDSGQKLFIELQDSPFALALTGLPYCSYSTLQKLADAIAQLFRNQLNNKKAMVILCETDMAKALGQMVAIRCRDRPPIVCIDQVQVNHGDYIDLGSPIAGEAIPITIKTLVFS